ncbi:MAG: DUF6290 family protein [Methanomassiliicoccaceae archaeon]|nr:DUF6290 family protein [Methanomassiliicoccaceae archaeon]
MRTITVSEMAVDERELIEAIRNYAKITGTSSKKVIKAMTEDLEDLIDARIADEAHKEHLKNPRTVSHDEVMREFGLR